jgi:Tol biopolymer transport system component
MSRKRVLAGFLAISVLFLAFAAEAAAAPDVIRFPAGLQLTRMPRGPFRTEMAFAPDGSFFVFSATPDGTMAKAKLYRRSLDRAESVVIPGTEAPCMPFFSPDGQWIGFYSGGKLLKVAVKGGMLSPICDFDSDSDIAGICWGPDGNIVFGTSESGLGTVSAAGGKTRPLTTLEAAKEATHRLPQALPGGKAIVFTSMPSLYGVEARIELLSLETGKRKVLIEDGADARYVPTGHLLFVRRGALMAAPFSLDRLEIAGPAVKVQAGLMQAFNDAAVGVNSGAGQYAVSDSGALIFVSGGVFPDPVADLYWVDRGGRAEKWTEFGTRPVMAIRLSPDGRQVAFTTHGLDRSTGFYDIQRGTVTVLTSGGMPWGAPVWTRDGKRAAFSWSKTGPGEIWWAAADGSGKMEQLRKTESEQRASSWTPDGQYLAITEIGRDTGFDIQVLRMSDRRVIPFIVTKSNEAFPDFSPDGRWLAYASDESGRNEIYIRSFPDGTRTLPISTDGGASPLWSQDGRELFFWNIGFTKLMKVDVVPGQNLSAGTPKPLFEFAATGSQLVRIYDITPDGQRFLVREKRDASVPPVTEVTLVRNWFEELKRLSPAAK